MNTYCPGCSQLVEETDMAWTADIRWRCTQCREIVCIHGNPINQYCRQCRQDYLAAGTPRMSGRPRADWHVTK